jgi:hypothetical protein
LASSRVSETPPFGPFTGARTQAQAPCCGPCSAADWRGEGANICFPWQ